MKRFMVMAMAALFTGCAEDTDAKRAAAIAKAQETLPEFWQAYDQRAHGDTNFVLVVRIKGKGTIFATDFERRNGKIMVYIGKKPKIVVSVFDDGIEIPEKDITDWFYKRDGKFIGMRTIKPRFGNWAGDRIEDFNSRW